MNCERFQDVISELARESMMEAAERTTALEHAAQCRSCAANLEQEQRLSEGLRALAQEMSSLSASADVEARVLQAFRERKTTPVVVPLPVRRSRTRYWAAAIAAALLIVFGLFVLKAQLGRQPDKTAETLPSPKSVDTPVGGSVQQPETPKDRPRNEVVNNSGGSAPRRHRRIENRKPTIPDANQAVAATTNKQQRAEEVVTDFFPIGYVNATSLQEGGQLLRVELPRAAVARFGLPVNMDRPGDRVKADVLVGTDGLAQAIRFVQ